MDVYILGEETDFVFGGEKMEKDPVCGAMIDEKKSRISYYFQGDTYHFCSSECREKFAEATVAGINP